MNIDSPNSVQFVGPITFYNLVYLGERPINNKSSDVQALNALTDICNSYVLHPEPPPTPPPLSNFSLPSIVQSTVNNILENTVNNNNDTTTENNFLSSTSPIPTCVQFNHELLDKQPVSKLELARNADGYLKIFNSGKNKKSSSNSINPESIPPVPDEINSQNSILIFKIALYDITQCVRLKDPTSIGARSFAVVDGKSSKVHAFLCTTSEIVTKILQNFDQVFQILPQAVIDEINSVSASSSARNSPRIENTDSPPTFGFKNNNSEKPQKIITSTSNMDSKITATAATTSAMHPKQLDDNLNSASAGGSLKKLFFVIFAHFLS